MLLLMMMILLTDCLQVQLHLILLQVRLSSGMVVLGFKDLEQIKFLISLCLLQNVEPILIRMYLIRLQILKS